MPISFLPSNNFPGTSRYSSVFLPSLNYRGSSAMRTPLGGGTQPTSNTTDYGVYDTATGKVISLKTGDPWSGIEPRTGDQYLNGVKVTTPAGAINPNDPTQRYKPVDIVKSPAIAGATGDLLAQFKKTADSSLEDFGASMKGATAARDTAFKRTQAVADIEPFAATMRGYQGRYSGALDTASEDYARLNEENAAATRALEAEGRGILPRYDAAADAIAARQEAALVNRIGRYKALSGTPTSLGSAEEQMLLGGIRDIRLPLEQAKIAREYDYLQNVSLPVERELANRETSRIAQFNPMIAGQQFQSGTSTEQTIQNLRLQTANMSFAQADSYLRSMGVPELLRQQVLSGQISQLGGLAALEEASRYRGLQDVMGVNVSQPQYYNVGTPGYPASQPRQPEYPVQQPNRYEPRYAPNAPVTVSPTTPEWVDYGDWQQNSVTGRWRPTPKSPAIAQWPENPGVIPGVNASPISERFNPNYGV